MEILKFVLGRDENIVKKNKMLVTSISHNVSYPNIVKKE